MYIFNIARALRVEGPLFLLPQKQVHQSNAYACPSRLIKNMIWLARRSENAEK